MHVSHVVLYFHAWNLDILALLFMQGVKVWMNMGVGGWMGGLFHMHRESFVRVYVRMCFAFDEDS